MGAAAPHGRGRGGGGAVAAVAIGLGAVAAVQVRANDRLEARRADETSRQARWPSRRQSRKQAEAVSRFLVEAFRSPDPSQDGREVKVVDVLDRASERLDKEFAGSQATRGALLHALGPTYHGLGLYDRAIGRARQGASPCARPRWAPTTPTRSRAAPTWPTPSGRPAGSRRRWRSTRRRSSGTEATLGADHPDTLTSRNNLALAYYDAGRTTEAIAVHEAVFRQRAATLGRDHPDTLRSAQQPGQRLQRGRPVGEGDPALRGGARSDEVHAGPRPPRDPHRRQQPRQRLRLRRPAGGGDRSSARRRSSVAWPSWAATTPTRP